MSGSPDSVTQTANRLLTSGTAEEIKAFVEIARGVISPQMLRSLLAREAYLRTIALAEWAASLAVNQARAFFPKIMNAFFVQGWWPPFNATTLAAMRWYQQVANNIIATYQRMIAGTTDPAKIARWQQDIANQQQRLNDIANWLRANGQTP
jgi:hypothetical protein